MTNQDKPDTMLEQMLQEEAKELDPEKVNEILTRIDRLQQLRREQAITLRQLRRAILFRAKRAEVRWASGFWTCKCCHGRFPGQMAVFLFDEKGTVTGRECLSDCLAWKGV